MLGGFGGFHLHVTQHLAHVHNPYHHCIICFADPPALGKEGKRAGSTLSFPFTLLHQFKWKLQPCMPWFLPPSSRMAPIASVAQLRHVLAKQAL